MAGVVCCQDGRMVWIAVGDGEDGEVDCGDDVGDGAVCVGAVGGGGGGGEWDGGGDEGGEGGQRSETGVN